MYTWINKQISASVPQSVRGLFVDTIIDIAHDCRDPEESNDIHLRAIRMVNRTYDSGDVVPSQRTELLKALANLAPQQIENSDTKESPDDSVRLLLQDRREMIAGQMRGEKGRRGMKGGRKVGVRQKF
jgi:hypothetical protein